MKTNKEIKPFKMRCESKEQLLSVESIINKFEMFESFKMGGETLAIVDEYNSFLTRYDDSGYFENRSEPELTYSEFMKLYGEEEEVFTREDMIMFAYGTLCSLSHSSTEEDVEHLLTAYLSTRTND